MASGSISSLGLGSGLELQSMLEQLKEVDQRPIETKKETLTKLEEKTEEFDSIKSSLLSIRSAALDLSLGSNFLETKTGVTGTSIEAASISGAKDMFHSINVTALASFSSWTSEGVASKTGVLTTEDNTFAYKLGENGNTITLDVDSGTSLQDLVNLINDDDSNPGVTASIADTGFGDNPYKLIIRSDESGEENRIFIETQLIDSPPESDNAVVINATEPIDILDTFGNNKIVFQERLADGSLGAEKTATIADGTYTSGSDLAAAVETAMETESENVIDYTVSYDSDTQKFSIKENGSKLHELNISWDVSNAASVLGFDAEEDVYKPHAGLKLTESTGAYFLAPASDIKVNISASEPADISAANNNNEIIFRERLADGTLGDAKTAVIADGPYTSGDDLAAAIKTAMETASENSTKFSVLFDNETNKFTIKEDGSNLHELQLEWGNSSAASTLGFDTETDIYTPYESSLNARFTVDNIAYQRQSNDDINDVILGVTIDLKETGISTIGVDSDFEKVESNIQEIISTLNTLRIDMDAKSQYDVETGERGILFGESSVTRIDNELKSFMEQELNLTGAVTSMYDLGLTIGDDGTISINSSVLQDVLSSNAEDVIKFFTGDSDNDVTGFADTLYDKMRDYTGVNGLLSTKIDSTQTRITKMEEQIEKDTEILDKRYETMTMQFIEMDSFMRQMQSEASFLDQVFNTNKNDD